MAAAQALPTLRLRLTRAAESKVRQGHPWVYSDSVRSCNRPGEVGDVAVIYDRKDRFLAVGLFDPHSPIQVRVLERGKPKVIDEAWMLNNLRRAVDARADLISGDTTGCRLIHGESDGWPALVLDRYEDTLVLKLYSSAWLPRIPVLEHLLRELLAPKRLVLRLSRNLEQIAESDFQRCDGAILFGEPVNEVPTFLESGIRFEADVVRGQKTGFFLDQRENRRRVGDLAHGRHVLNAFSFSGGFSLYAARAGALSVTDVDISAHALEGAERNFALNPEHSAIAQCEHHRIQADVFKWLERSPARSFGLIVLDPPSLARRKSERPKAISAYRRLVSQAIRRLNAGGVLFAASCSAQVSADDFFHTVREAARSSGRRFTEIETAGQPSDHPSSFSEASYLKGIYLKFQ